MPKLFHTLDRPPREIVRPVAVCSIAFASQRGQSMDPQQFMGALKQIVSQEAQEAALRDWEACGASNQRGSARLRLLIKHLKIHVTPVKWKAILDLIETSHLHRAFTHLSGHGAFDTVTTTEIGVPQPDRPAC